MGSDADSHERQAKRMDALARRAIGPDMKASFEKLAAEFRVLARAAALRDDRLDSLPE
jgi:hypothetical protein